MLNDPANQKGIFQYLQVKSCEFNLLFSTKFIKLSIVFLLCVVESVFSKSQLNYIHRQFLKQIVLGCLKS